MNILPLVSAFILIFSIGSLALLRHCKAALLENKDCTTAFSMQREIYNKISEDRYKKFYEKQQKIKTEDKEKEKNFSSYSKKKDQSYPSPRNNIPPFPYAKLNIAKLCKETTHENHTKLKEIALKLIKNIYEYTCIYSKGMEEVILETLVETAKANPSITSFEDLFLFIPQEKAELFYKVFKGTQSYTLHTSQGYPPLRDFILLNYEKKHKPIYLVHAAKPVLIAVFNENIARKILYAEEQKWEQNSHNKQSSLLKKEEIESLLLQEGTNLSNLEDLVDYSRKKNTHSEKMYIDNASNKTIRWKNKV